MDKNYKQEAENYFKENGPVLTITYQLEDLITEKSGSLQERLKSSVEASTNQIVQGILSFHLNEVENDTPSNDSTDPKGINEYQWGPCGSCSGNYRAWRYRPSTSSGWTHYGCQICL